MYTLHRLSLVQLLALASVIGATLPSAVASKSLIDYFLPMPPQGPLVSKGIWGATEVLPQDIKNGLEDQGMSDWCYWDGSIVRSDDGRYHMYASRWTQGVSHSVGWHIESKGTHAVSDTVMGPYRDVGLLWPNWNNGLAHNVVALRIHDGPNDNHGSKIVVVPFDGESFDRDMQAIVAAEKEHPE